PEWSIETLLVPAHASWLKTCEAIDFAKAVGPRRAYPMHDGQLNERGLSSVNGWFGEEIGAGYRYLEPGESVTIG
ncbi:MAG: MBL fold metallo-hydrolase, partial [Micromonosporaceae bacterium]